VLNTEDAAALLVLSPPAALSLLLFDTGAANTPSAGSRCLRGHGGRRDGDPGVTLWGAVPGALLGFRAHPAQSATR